MSLRNELLEETDPREEIVAIQTRKGLRNVLVTEMSVGERTAFDLAKEPEKDADGKPGPVDMSDIRERLIVATARDPETRELLFTAEDTAVLATKGAGMYEPVVDVAQKLNGMAKGEAAAEVKN